MARGENRTHTIAPTKQDSAIKLRAVSLTKEPIDWDGIRTHTSDFADPHTAIMLPSTPLSSIGFEPTTLGLQNHCSTIELRGLQGEGIEPSLSVSKTDALPLGYPWLNIVYRIHHYVFALTIRFVTGNQTHNKRKKRKNNTWTRQDSNLQHSTCKIDVLPIATTSQSIKKINRTIINFKKCNQRNNEYAYLNKKEKYL